MNIPEAEQTALMIAVAEANPKLAKWDSEAEWVEIGWTAQSHDFGHLALGRDDQSNGTPIMAMLDAMEAKMKGQWCDTPFVVSNRECYECFLGFAIDGTCDNPGDGEGATLRFEGPTRAIAVAKAFIHVFKDA